jgi:hypothetical protein
MVRMAAAEVALIPRISDVDGGFLMRARMEVRGDIVLALVPSLSW